MDEIRLTVPRRRDYFTVARLVVSGIGSRLELTVDRMEDLELALDTLLDRIATGDELTIAVRVRNGGLETEVGPVGAQVGAELERGDAGMTLGRILGTLVDEVSIGQRDGEQWVTLTKRIA